MFVNEMDSLPLLIAARMRNTASGDMELIPLPLPCQI
jgi:hypothetical protein